MARAALYLVDDAGVRWRVHDATYSGGRPHRVPLGDRRATFRYFIGADGTRRVAELKPGSDRRLEPRSLAAQLRGSAYAARELHRPEVDAPGWPGD